MKKILLVALAAAAMVGCSQNEEIENAGQKAEINFSALVKNSTRALVVNQADFKSFKVYGYTTTENIGAGITLTSFMPGVTVNKADGTDDWSYTGDPYYWPLTGYVQFFSVVPETSLRSDGGYPKFDYTVGVIGDQEDLIAANLKDQQKTSSALKLPFNHLLTQVNFSISGDKGFTYSLTDLELVGVKDKGTFTFDGTSTAGGWTNQQFTAPTPTVYKYSGSVELISDGTNSTRLDDDANALFMLLPQTIADEAVKVKVTYTAKITVGGQIM